MGAVWGFRGGLSLSPHAKGIKTMTTVNGLRIKNKWEREKKLTLPKPSNMFLRVCMCC